MGNMYEKINELIKLHHTNATALCRKAGISRSVLSELKAGRTKSLSVENATKLAVALEVPFSELMPNAKVKISGIEFDDEPEKGIKKESVITDGLSELDLETIELIKRMSDEDRKRLANFAKALLASEPQD